MENAKRDQNFVPTLLGVSNVDGATPVPIYADPVTHRLLVDLPGGTGTVTGVSVVSANGFAGTVATSTTTPAITISTTVTGILYGNGTAISALTIGSGLSLVGSTLSATGGGTGTVTSVDMTVPTGLVVTGNPVTTSGTLAVALDTGYVIPLSSTLATYVVGPASATDNAIARFDLTTGKLIQNSGVTVNDANGIETTIASGGNSTGLTVTQNDTVNNPNGIRVINSGAGYDVGLENVTSGNFGSSLSLYHNSATPAANDNIGVFDFYGNDSGANVTQYARLSAQITDPTNGSEDSNVFVSTRTNGTLATRLVVGSGTNGILVGDAVSSGVVSSFGNQDLILQTGNVTTGTITLADGANGNISLTPNGTGAVAISTTLELGNASDTTISRVSAGVIAVEGVVIPSISSTNTLTNKRITKRTGTTTSSATPTINTDNVDFYSLTAQAVDITSFTTNLSGTPTDGQTLWIAITGTAARAITWGASFEASTVALPTTTVTTARLDVGFVWNAATSKWRCIAVA